MTDHKHSDAAPRSAGARNALADIAAGDRGTMPVVGIGASAGGLDACRRLLGSLPSETGMAFILVQHLDPSHESMMVSLLSGHTAMTVRNAEQGMPIEPDHLYVIAPGTYLSVAHGTLQVSPPSHQHGSRLPFDFLLHSIAAEYGALGFCVVLSGTGSDGTAGVASIRRRRGYAVAQAPADAGYAGMPQSAISSGLIDLVIPASEIGAALIGHVADVEVAEPDNAGSSDTSDRLPEIIEVLRERTGQDFAPYKQGTLSRRIERRVGLAAIMPRNVGTYLALLRTDREEVEQLARDLLIHVTGFFRDPIVFAQLETEIIPGLVSATDASLRVWVAGCSTGEEAYSLAILLCEALGTRSDIKLQIFASDLDPDSVAVAREGFYNDGIEADVSTNRLARFFSREPNGYRVSPELRACVIFTTQDLLSDPPFSRIDFVSCRNVMIYLDPAAQAKALSLFSFALRDDGVLLLGNVETIGPREDQFALVLKDHKIFRKMRRPHAVDALPDGRELPHVARTPVRLWQAPVPLRQGMLANLCRQIVIDTHAPAAVLTNSRFEILYSLGPTERYLGIVPGHPTHNLLALARRSLRAKLRSAMLQVASTGTKVVLGGARVDHNGGSLWFSIDVQPVRYDREDMMLVCFIDEPARTDAAGSAQRGAAAPEVQLELEATRAELQSAIRDLEFSGEDQKVILEEAMSINEEYQSTNEELLTSKEELQSLNEELTALNTQLQETLERQRTTSNDLQNVLYSADLATIFLDVHLNIRFFTPATRLLFRVIPGDVGRPLADLHSLAEDPDLLADAASVLASGVPKEREIGAAGDAWYVRRVLPYLTPVNEVEGVVITFTDVSERHRAAAALDAARREAEVANAAKTRFLAAASHDLRQPLQTLALLQGLLAKMVHGTKQQELVSRVDDTLVAMSGTLNTLLDINQIEAGVVLANKADFAINDLLELMRDEFTYHAVAQQISLRTVASSAVVHTDRHRLEQMMRNLCSNALKYTRSGKVVNRRAKLTPDLECAPRGRQDQAAVLTGCRVC